MNEQLIAQWVIDNRYPKSEQEKVSDSEMYYYIVEAFQSLQPNEQLIEELKDLRIYLKAIKATMYVDSIGKAIQALTSVKSEPKEQLSADEVFDKYAVQIAKGGIIKWMRKEDFIQAMHDFANNSEAMKENAIGFLDYTRNDAYYIGGNRYRTYKNQADIVTLDELYNIYLTNKEK